MSITLAQGRNAMACGIAEYIRLRKTSHVFSLRENGDFYHYWFCGTEAQNGEAMFKHSVTQGWNLTDIREHIDYE